MLNSEAVLIFRATAFTYLRTWVESTVAHTLRNNGAIGWAEACDSILCLSSKIGSSCLRKRRRVVEISRFQLVPVCLSRFQRSTGKCRTSRFSAERRTSNWRSEFAIDWASNSAKWSQRNSATKRHGLWFPYTFPSRASDFTHESALFWLKNSLISVFVVKK